MFERLKIRAMELAKARKPKKTFIGLVILVIIAFLVMSQMLYNRNYANYVLEQRPNEQSIIEVSSREPVSRITKQLLRKTVFRGKNKCPDVLRLMTVGKWVKKKSSKREIQYIEKFLNDSRTQLQIISNLSRSDGKCGNITLQTIRYTRALCDPKGDKPCCHENTCKALSVKQCQCENCYDMRQRIHAEHATWTPADKRCKMRNFTASEACSLLSGSHLYLLGDSYLRHLYTAVLMIVKNDWRFAGLRPSVDEKTRTRCEGMYSFGSKECRPLWNRRPGSMCNRTFLMTYIGHSRSYKAPELLQLANKTLNKEKVVLMPGQGLYENCNATITKTYIGPSVKFLKSKRAKWPKLIWATVHAPGMMKSPFFRGQDSQRAVTFNNEMKQYLSHFGIPVFDTFNMTSETLSYDGSHYGLGVNIAKAQLFLNYLQELRDQGQW